MEKGEIRFHGPTAELLERPDLLRSVFLEGATSAGRGDRSRVAAGSGTASSRRGARRRALEVRRG